MAGKKHYVAFDLGAESGRAVLGSLSGSKLVLDEKHRFANAPVFMNGHLHWNLPSLWAELKLGLRKAAGVDAGKRPLTLAGVGVDTWGVDFGLVAANGELLGLPVCYRDSRTDGMMPAVFKKVPREDVFGATGIQLMQLNTLFQLYSMTQANSPLLDSAARLLHMPDLFTYLFSGEMVHERSIASTSQMYDPRKKAWAKGLLDKLGIPTHFLGKIASTGSRAGRLRAEVASECGVEAPVLSTAGHDTAAAVAAVPAEGDANWCYLSSGTWSLMGVELDEPIIDASSLAANYTNELGAGGKVRFLKNIIGLWLVQECRRQFARDGAEYDYTQLTRMAREARPFAAAIDTDHGEFLKPGDMPGKIARFCKSTKQKAPATPGEYVRTCLESLALTYRRTLDGLEALTGRKIEVIHIVGGGSQNELLNQMAADACHRRVVAGPVEATAAGNILVQAMATGDVASLAAARKIVRRSFPFKTYEPSQSADWDKAYDRFCQVAGA
jgi:rhamnulokinase